MYVYVCMCLYVALMWMSQCVLFGIYIEQRHNSGKYLIKIGYYFWIILLEALSKYLRGNWKQSFEKILDPDHHQNEMESGRVFSFHKNPFIPFCNGFCFCMKVLPSVDWSIVQKISYLTLCDVDHPKIDPQIQPWSLTQLFFMSYPYNKQRFLWVHDVALSMAFFHTYYPKNSIKMIMNATKITIVTSTFKTAFRTVIPQMSLRCLVYL